MSYLADPCNSLPSLITSIQLNQQHLLDQECCQAPTLRGACPALENEDDDEVAKEERNLGKEGPEDEEERDSHAPEGLLF